MNVRIPHFFSSEDIAILMNDPAIALQKEKPGQMVHFSITIPDSIQSKLKKNNEPSIDYPNDVGTWRYGRTYRSGNVAL